MYYKKKICIKNVLYMYYKKYVLYMYYKKSSIYVL